MKAFVRHKYGGPYVLKIEEVAKPLPKADEVLVKIKASALNPYDWRMLRASPIFVRLTSGLFKPKNKLLGADLSGVIEAIGENVKEYKVGDEIIAEASTGSFAEYICLSCGQIAKKAPNVSFEEAAGIVMAGLTAFQGVREHAKVKKGDRVLINGGTGGVGHLCTQLVRYYGGTVTAICSGRNEDLAKTFGASEVIDYKKINIHNHTGKYDVILDTHGNLKYSDYKRMSANEGRNIIIGFTTMKHMLGLMLKSSFGKTKIISYTARVNSEDLAELSKLQENDSLKVHLDHTFPFEELPKGITYIEKKATRGKIAISHNFKQIK